MMLSCAEDRATTPIIMVDDSSSDAMIARMCHERSACGHPLICLNGPAALFDHLSRVEEGSEPMPSRILLDLNMPDMNGFQVLEAIRSRTLFSSRPPVIILTHSDDPTDRARSEEAGADGYVTKPFMTEDYVSFFDELKN